MKRARLSALSHPKRGYHSGEKRFCKDDHRKFCCSYGLNSNALGACIDGARE